MASDQLTFVIAGLVGCTILVIIFGLIALCCKRLIRRTSPEGRAARLRRSRATKRHAKHEAEEESDDDENDDPLNIDEGGTSGLDANVKPIPREEDDDEDNVPFKPLPPDIARFDKDSFKLAEEGLLLPREGLPRHLRESLAKPFVSPSRRVYPVHYDNGSQLIDVEPTSVSASVVVAQPTTAVRPGPRSVVPEESFSPVFHKSRLNPFRPLSGVHSPSSRWAEL